MVASELEFFIKGVTDKEWLKERKNHIWDEWCSPDKVAYAHDEATKKKMMEERELGPIYGWQWRHFGAKYASFDKPPVGRGVDQLKKVITTLRENPSDRRMMLIKLTKGGLDFCMEKVPERNAHILNAMKTLSPEDRNHLKRIYTNLLIFM